jgi:autotransporter passenger strand-loop-strand repeat protein
VFGGTVVGATVNSGGDQRVFTGGVAIGTAVNSGGREDIAAGSTASGTTIFGGTVEVQSAGTAANVSFAGTGGLLKLGQPSGLTGTISSWAIGDTIDFVGTSIIYATVIGSSLTVTDAKNETFTYQLAGCQADTTVSLQSDNAGGTDLVLVPVIAWAGPTAANPSGSWNTAANWSPASVPGPNDNAAIGAGGTYTIASAVSNTVRTLTIDDPAATLDVTGGTFTISSGTGSSNAGTIKVEATAQLVLDDVFAEAATALISAAASGAVIDLAGGGLSGGKVNIVTGALVEATGGPGPSVIGGGAVVVDAGTLEVTGNSTLMLATATINATITATNGAITGGIIEAIGGGSGIVLGGATINGGELATAAGGVIAAAAGTSSILNGVTIAAGTTVTVVDGSTAEHHYECRHRCGGASPGAVVLAGATILGGTLAAAPGGAMTTAAKTTSTLNGVTLAAGTTVQAADASTLALKGTITNGGMLALNSTSDATRLAIGGNVTLTGGGHVVFTDVVANAITASGTTAAAPAKLTNFDNTIAGAGTIGTGDATLKLTNQATGTINADGANALTIDTGNSVTNVGLIEATGSGGLVIKDAVSNGGTIAANGGKVTIFGSLSGSGAAQIFSGNQIEVKNASNSGKVVFENNGGDNGLLAFDDASSFKGTVAGFYSDGTRSDMLDLKNIDFASGVSWSFKQSGADAGAKGTLTVSDHLGNTASIALLGQYLAAAGTESSPGVFHLAADSTSPTAGTLITTSVLTPH